MIERRGGVRGGAVSPVLIDYATERTPFIVRVHHRIGVQDVSEVSQEHHQDTTYHSD